LVVVVVEVTRKAYLAALVPVIVDAILMEHQVVADIVAFVSHGDFPRSRLGEKQRGKVLASWVTRKLRTVAQFSIRDLEGNNPFADMPQHRMSRVSKPGSTMGNSIRQSSMYPDTPDAGVPRSPAGLTLEETVHPAPGYNPDRAGSMPHELQTATDNSVVATPVPQPSPAVPYIKEPQSATVVTEFDDHHYDTSERAEGNPHANRDFRFSFDMGNTPDQAQSQGYPPGGEPRESLGNQQGWDHPSDPAIGIAHAEPARPRTQDSGVIEDWPQEALMYQSALGAEDGHDFHRTNSNNAAGHPR
jgi:hypothetical protein